MQLSTADLTDFSALIDQVYAGALNPRVWPEVVENLSHWIGASKTFLHTPMNTRTDGLFIAHGFKEGELELYHAKYQAIDPWREAAITQGYFQEGTVVLGSQLVTDEQLRLTPFYKEYLIPSEALSLVAGVIFDGMTPGTLITVISLFRGSRQQQFTPSDRDRLGLVLPHLARAFGVMYRLREADLRIAASLNALDGLAAGTLLIAPNGEVVFANQAAHALLTTNDGLSLRDTGGRNGHRLFASSARVQDQLDKALFQALHGDTLQIPHFSQGLSIPRPSGREPFTLQFSALTENNEFGQGIATPRAIVFISTLASPITLAPEQLMQLYQLTPAEARLAIALGNGDGLQEVAEQLGVSHNTAKTQLQWIYSKTGVDSRAKLTKLLFALANH